MNYEKKYKEALEVAQKLYQDCPNGKNDRLYHTTDLEKMFPELKESEDEDERMKKSIIQTLKKYSKCVEDGNDSPSAKDFLVKDIENQIAWLEKQGEQKPTDKVEPKFKVGDFIENDYCFGKVIALTDDAYLLDTEQGIPFSCEHNAHLWTIQDAKDGDVVVNKSDGSIGIFQSIGHHPDGGSYNDPSYCFLHCRYDDGFFFEDFEDGNTMNSGDVIPATKEQRDLLFQKMKEAGYEWDADKKELKKIKQKPSAWGKEDDIMLRDILGWLPAKSRPEYNQIRVEWLKSLKQRIGWKPSDEQMHTLHDLNLTGNISYAGQGQTLIELYNDLKKLTEE